MRAPDSAPARAFLVDDHEVVLHGLGAVIGRSGDVVVVGAASSGAEALERLASIETDVAVVDLSLHDVPSEEVIRRIAAMPEPPAVLAHGLNDTPASLRSAIAAGARGYLSRCGEREEVVDGVRALVRGWGYVSPCAAGIVLDLARGSPSEGALSSTERAVLRGIARGERSGAIASRLGLSARRVESARTRLRGRLGARSTADLVRFAVAAGILDLDEE